MRPTPGNHCPTAVTSPRWKWINRSQSVLVQGRHHSNLQNVIFHTVHCAGRRITCFPTPPLSPLPWLTPAPLHVLEVLFLNLKFSINGIHRSLWRESTAAWFSPTPSLSTLCQSTASLFVTCVPCWNLLTVLPGSIFSDDSTWYSQNKVWGDFADRWLKCRCRHPSLLPRPNSGCFFLQMEQVS